MPNASKAKTESALKLLLAGMAVICLAWIVLSLRTANTSSVHLANQTLVVEVVEEPEEQARGLSGREFLADDSGMLFVFERPSVKRFWMKDMLIPIDIIWIDADKQVVHIENSVQPETYPEVFSPNVQAQYVLETAAGWSRSNNLGLGDKVVINLR